MTAVATAQHAVTATTRRIRATAVAGTVIVNGALYPAGRALGVDFKITDPGKTEAHQLILPEIAVFTLLFALLGWAALALLERFTRRARTVWTVLAAAVLTLSLAPIFIEQATAATRAMLVVVHVAVAAVLIPALRTRR